MSTSSVASVLNGLAGVYRDPMRVTSEANRLMNHELGKYLFPMHSSLIENNGVEHAKLFTFHGTVPITFRGAVYNIPVDIYLPPSFPLRPPIAYVRPTAVMVIVENHRHVGSDGMVYLPYLHEWRARSSNMVEMVVAMTSVFGVKPPVFARPAASQPPPPPPPSSNNAGSIVGRPTISSTISPPGYNDIQTALAESAAEEEKRLIRQKQEEAKLEEARLASLAEAHEIELVQKTRERLTSQVQSCLKAFYAEKRALIIEDLRETSRLEKAEETLDNLTKQLEERKQELSEALDTVKVHNDRLRQWLNVNDANEDEKKEDLSVDDVVVASDVHSQQMLDLSSENAAITDCLYFLDRNLVSGQLPLDVHQKKVRALAKKQFFARAHLLKIVEHRGPAQSSP